MKTKDPLILSIRPDLCTILHQLYNLKNVKSTNRGVILSGGAAFDKTEWKLTLRAKPKLTWKKCWTCKSNKYELKKKVEYLYTALNEDILNDRI